jgi:hypothetical protein
MKESAVIKLQKIWTWMNKTERNNDVVDEKRE